MWIICILVPLLGRINKEVSSSGDSQEEGERVFAHQNTNTEYVFVNVYGARESILQAYVGWQKEFLLSKIQIQSPYL